MAIYEYEILSPSGTTTGIYEAEQKMSDPPLLQHPETGAPLRRILSRTFAGNPGERGSGECASGGCCAQDGCGGGAGDSFGVGGCSGGGCSWG